MVPFYKGTNHFLVEQYVLWFVRNQRSFSTGICSKCLTTTIHAWPCHYSSAHRWHLGRYRWVHPIKL